jgi:magnesium-protoporphyrin O-methyltransferase
MRINSASNIALVGVVVAVASSVDAFSSSSSSLHASSLTTLSTKSTTTFLLAVSENSAIDDKTEVRDYFNNEGFNRWNKIYSNSDEVNTVQLDIRKGHDMTISKIINWIKEDGNIAGKTVCDCGCGVGSLAIPLAQMGAVISASDISSSMANEAAERANNMGITTAKFYTSDLESVTGKYNTVTCVDVAIHYPTDKMAQMIGHLCSLADERVMISFAPKTWYYEILKKIGEFFPGPSKTTRAYLHDEAVVREALSKAGFKVAREEMTGTSFYFSRLLEAKRV